MLWYESPSAHLPYDAVVRTALGADADPVIAYVTAPLRHTHDH